jgi:hypothetical protein
MLKTYPETPPCRPNRLGNSSLYSENVKRSKGEGKSGTYDSDYQAEPRSSVQRPDPIAEVFLNDQRNDSVHNSNVHGGVMRTLEAFHVAKSGKKPIVDVRPSQRSLDSLQCEHEIS